MFQLISFKPPYKKNVLKNNPSWHLKLTEGQKRENNSDNN